MNSPKKFAIVLSGCGVFDGAEIHEAVMTMYAITLNGALYEIFAPDVEQYHVMNHATGKAMNETRNVMVEAARIARGKIHALSTFDAQKFDALVFPGGFGAAKNLSSWAFDGAKAKLNRDVKTAIVSMHKLKKPIGALCISPVLFALAFGNVQITIGDETPTIEALESLGAKHTTISTHGQVVVDEQNLLFSTPCYMLNASVVDIAEGAKAIISKMMEYLR
jgi:enhancing lycopene biosynthesis protein 2